MTMVTIKRRRILRELRNGMSETRVILVRRIVCRVAESEAQMDAVAKD
jgi:hypothetical protein